MNGLNDQQRDAVQAGEGPILIVAGPGTGKTKTLTARIAHLIAGGIDASQILALTFTVKSARQMKEQVSGLLGGATAPDISTFHSLGYRLLRQLRPDAELKFVSEAERLSIIRELSRPKELKPFAIREIALMISRLKGTVEPVADPMLEVLLGRYQDALAAAGLLDYDDLLYRAYRELSDRSDLRDAWRGRYRSILIDEFQDTSEMQWELIGQICGNDNLFVIGDPKQSIYGFRGASAAMFDRFRSDFPDHLDITLQINYRSDQNIVALASAVFGGRDALSPHSTAPGNVQAVRTLNEFSEAEYVLQRIEEGIGGSDLLKATTESPGRRFRDFAVLYRTHQAAKAVQHRLHDSGIPFQVVGEGSPYEQAEVQAVIGALRWFDDGGVPTIKGFSDTQVLTLLEGIEAAQSVSKLTDGIVAAFNLAAGGEAQRQRLKQFVAAVVRFDEREDGLRACLNYIDQLSQGDFYDPQVDAVTLLTIHASKGLEFPHVLLIATEEGILPNIRKTKETDFDEEKRLFYVAVTRAQHQLDIIYTAKRAGEARELSRFASELDGQVLPKSEDPNAAQLQKKLKRREQKARQATLF